MELKETLELCIQTLDVHAKTLVAEASATLVPTSDEPFGADRADIVLARLRGGTERLVVGEAIGEGGMGIVHSATQVALGRVVAVKRVRDAKLGAKHERALVAEALITGSLEHPNVIPVYEIDVDPAGAPVLVMKRIEGEPWSRLLHDPAALQERGASEPIVFHLKILTEVCNAVHFAHSRNVIHRDLKPDNVLIGHFGEVYLADWGIASAPGPCTRISGTPAYMAPEMLLCEELTTKTDVYLLGSVLFEIVVGHAPHKGATTHALLSSIVMSAPEITASVPDELANLIRECMAREPADRPASARAVRERVEAFLEHRGSTALALRADMLAGRITSAIANGAERSSIYETFTECRFAYREALRAWLENAHAKTGLHAVLRRMLEHEIERGDLAAVKLLTSELPELETELHDAIAALEEREHAKAARIDRLAKLEHELDPQVGRRARLTVGVSIGLLWTGLPLLGRVVGIHFGQVETLVAVPVTLLVLVVFAVTGRLAGWQASQLNRRLVRAFAFVLFVEAAAAAILYAFHIPHHFVAAGLFFYWFAATGIVAAAIELRLFSASLAYLLAFVVVLEWPSARYVCATGVNAFFTVAMAFIWLRGSKQKIETRS